MAELDFTTKSKEFQQDLKTLKGGYETDQQEASTGWARDEETRAKIRTAIERGDLDTVASVLEFELQNETLPVPLNFELELSSTESARVDISLPPLTEIPETVTSLTTRGKLSTKAMGQRNRAALYTDVCTALCLRLLFEMFRVVPSLHHVEAFGSTTGVDPATGHERAFVALHVETTRESIAALDLDRVDPSTAMAALGGILSADRSGNLTPIPGVAGLDGGADHSPTKAS